MCERKQLVVRHRTTRSHGVFLLIVLLVLVLVPTFASFGSHRRIVPVFFAIEAAQADSSVEIFGFELPCGNCELRNDSGCSVFLSAEKREVSCEAAVPELLRKAAQGKVTKGIRVEDLRRYVFRDDVSVEGAEAAFQLLALTNEGQNTLAADVSSLATKRLEAFSRFLKTGDVPRPVLDAVFRLPRLKTSEYLRGLAVSVDKQRAPTALVEELPALDAQSDTHDVVEYARALKEVRPDWSDRFAVLSSIITDCGNARTEEFGALCLSRELPEGLSSLGRYFLKLKTHMTLQRLPSPEVPLDRKAGWLAKLDVSKYRTPESLAGMRHFVAELLKRPLGEQHLLIEEKGLAFLREAGRYDKEIAALHALLLVRYSASIWDLGSEREAVRALLESYEIFPESLEARTSLVARISFKLPREERWYQQAWAKLPREAQAELTWVPQNTGEIIAWVIGFSALVIIALSGFIVYLRHERARHRRPQQARPASLVSMEGVAELRKLLSYFELKLPVSEQQLTRRYRQKAKIFHPDAVSGTSEEFTQLTARYQRAKELLQELSRFSGGKKDSNSEKRA